MEEPQRSQEQVSNVKNMLANMLAGKVDPEINAMRQVTSIVENKELPPIEAKGQNVLDSGPKRLPPNVNTTKMPKSFYANMIPDESQTDKLWEPSEGNSNGLASSILSEEREPPQSKYDTMKLINERLENKKTTTQSPNKPYPQSQPLNSSTPVNSGLQSPPQQTSMGGLSESKVREIIKEEVWSALEKIVKKEEENRLSEETIQIRIGKTVFSGNLKPIVKTKKK